MKAYKILQIGGGNFIGGGRSKVIYELCKHFDVDKYEVWYHIVKPLPDELKKNIQNVLYIVSPYNNKIMNLFNDSFQFIKNIKKQNFDIIHFNTDSIREQWRYIILSIIFTNSKIVIHGHNTRCNHSERSVRWFRSIFMVFFKQSVALFLACSREAAVYLVGQKYIDKAYILNNGISISEYCFNKSIRNNLRNLLGIGNDIFVLGSVGRLSRQKNYTYLIDIFYDLRKKYKNCMLIIVGEGELRTQLQEKINKLGLQENVKLLGMQSNVNEYLQVFDVFCLPSLYEGFGIVNIEAQASGLPCVISDKCPKAVDVTGEVLFLPIEKTPDFWSDNIMQFIDDHSRYEKTNMIREKGFDIQDSSWKLMELYNEILK